MNKIFLKAVVAGFIAFAWGNISWMALPFHGNSMKDFSQPKQVAEVLQANTPDSGIYVIKDCEQSGAAAEDRIEKPFVFVAITKEGLPFSPKQIILYLTTQIIAALIIVHLLQNYSGTYFQKVLFVTGTAFAGLWLSTISGHIWWNLPLDYTLLDLADGLIAWFLAGLFLARD